MYDRDYIKQNSYESDFGVKHHFSDSVYAKQLHLPKGHIALSHKHKYSHLSVLAAGSCKLYREIDGKVIETKHKAPDVIDIPAGIEHQVEATEDVTWLCIHATTETDPDKIDKVVVCESD